MSILKALTQFNISLDKERGEIKKRGNLVDYFRLWNFLVLPTRPSGVAWLERMQRVANSSPL